jgi:PAS domain S-box-containing protein
LPDDSSGYLNQLFWGCTGSVFGVAIRTAGRGWGQSDAWHVALPMKRNQTTGFWRSAALFLCGVTALALLTLVCFQLQLNLTITALTFLMLIVLLSLMGSFIASVVLSIIAVGCLNYFFTEPRFSFRVDYPQDVVALIAFLTTSLVVTGLMERTRRLAEAALDSQKSLERAFQDIQALKDQLGLVIDTIPGLIWSALPDGSNDFVNKGWVEYTGLSLEDTKGSGWSAAIHPDDLVAHWDRWRMSVATGERFEDEARFRRADGQYRWFVVRAAPLRDDLGNIIKWYGKCTDIDESKRAAARVRQAERELRIVVDTIPALVWSTLPDGSSDFNNRRWLDYTGLSSEQAKGWGYGTAIHPEDFERARAEWAARFAAGEPFEEESRLRRADGEYRHFLNRAVPLRDELGNVVKWYGTSTDIEDRKRAEVLQAELARVTCLTTMGELTASIAHEVIQPLSAVVTNGNTCLHWLADETTDLAKARSAAARAVRDAERACDIVRRIRALMTKSETQKVEVDMNGIIREVLALTRDELLKRQVSVYTAFTATLPPIFGDRVQLQQLILNLIMNGIESMAPVAGRPKELTIETHVEGTDHVLVRLRDSGVGLNLDKTDQIFEAFFTTKPEGTGMGLAICRSIVEAHHGRIWASPGTPHGAVFHFSLPMNEIS